MTRDNYQQLIKIIGQRLLFLTASLYFLKPKDREKQSIRIQELIDLIDTQRGTVKEREKKIQAYAHFEKPLKLKGKDNY